MNDYLNSPVTILKGIGEKTAKILEAAGIYTIYDILTIFPAFYINLDEESDNILPGKPAVFNIDVKNCNLYRRYGRRFSVINIFGECLGEQVRIRIFNLPYYFDKIKNLKTLKIFSFFLYKDSVLTADNPLIIEDRHKNIIPVYKKIGSIGTGRVERFIKTALLKKDKIVEFLPGEIINKQNFFDLYETLRQIQFPEKKEDLPKKEFYNRFKYCEFLKYHLELNYIRKKIRDRSRVNSYNHIKDLAKTIEERLGFRLTKDQLNSIEKIKDDLQSTCCMQRLIMGEVGSGKTAVAFGFLLAALKNGYQGALIAPTGILASQHFERAGNFFKEFKVELLTGNTSSSERKEIIRNLSEGEINLVIGTHSLIYEKVKFKNLVAVVIDEQHRFGVAQRAAVFYKGSNCDLLVTTATPIPRTLLISMYGDLKVSKIISMPKNRHPVRTHVINPLKRDEFYADLKDKIVNGESGYIVIPLIESSENFSGLRSLETEIPYFEKILKNIRFEVISGRSPDEKKKETFSKFRSGKISLIISTTVIEVGIDVKRASFIVIEDADRFGLSQLHQLRGRVGRGDLPADCYLVPRENITSSGKERIKIIRETTDGFKIAEKDLKMRGPGLIQGYRQSGRFDFRIGDPSEDFDLFLEAGKDSELLLNSKIPVNNFIKNIFSETEIKLKTINLS